MSSPALPLPAAPLESTAPPFRLGHCPALDGLRGVSIILVMAVHLRLIEPVLWFTFPGGTLGVDVFFGLSGFLITLLLLQENSSSGQISLKGFYYRRALRLLPALITVLLFVVLIASAVGSFSALGLTRLRMVSTVFYFTNWVRAYQGPETWFLGHFWSLALEEQFYFCWPLVMIAALRLKLTKRTIFLAIVSLVAASVVWKLYLVWNGVVLRRIFFGSDTRGDGILVGCAMAVAIHGRMFPSILNAKAASSLSLTGFLLLGIFAVLGDDGFVPVYCGGTTIVAFAATLITAGSILNPSNSYSKALSSNWLTWLGRRSYGVYLWHWPLYEVARNWVPSPFIVPVALTSTVLIAALSYRFIEAPFLRRKDRRTGSTVVMASQTPPPKLATVNS